MSFLISKHAEIHPTAVIDVKEGYIGAGALILQDVRIEGTRVELGRMAFLGRGATIGGGSCWDPCAFFKAGDFLHMGSDSHVNTARGVTCGDEVGLGFETKIFTHGAYIDSYALGAPAQFAGVTIGSNVWLPNAWVNPGISIGDNVVVAARSLVNRSIPSGALAGGIPAKLLDPAAFPRIEPSPEALVARRRALLDQIFQDARMRNPHLQGEVLDSERIRVPNCLIDVARRTIAAEDATSPGAVNDHSKVVLDQLRRYGIRFRYAPGQSWLPWGKDVMTFVDGDEA